MIEKKFCSILEGFSSAPQKARDDLKDKRLSQVEKVIIENYLLLRKNDNEKVLENLASIKMKLSPFVEIQKELLLGLALNNLYRFEEAAEYLKRTLPYFRINNYSYFEFIARINLCTIYYNTKQAYQMKTHLRHLLEIKIREKKHTLSVVSTQLRYYLLSDQLDRADEIVEELQLFTHEMSESDHVFHLVDMYCLNIKKENFELCLKTIDEMKSIKSFKLSVNFQFMKKMLNHYLDHSPIYFTAAEFEPYPLLYHQMSVIQKLESGDCNSAELHWNKLQLLFPEIYQNNFSYLGDKSIFSLCLGKYSTLTREGNLLKVDDVEEGASLTERLAQILSATKVPIQKEVLFKALWGTMPESKDDITKLSKAVNRVRSKYHLDIKSRNGAYYISETIKSKAS